jgi:hypothetical protein
MGVAAGLDGKPLAGPLNITFLIYKEPQGGEPLWYETETVSPGVAGKFTVDLGATEPNGLPTDLFSNGEARWLEVRIEGQFPGVRTLLTSVPYAMKAADAETLGGQRAANFVTQEQFAASFRTTAEALAAQSIQPLIAGTVTGSGTSGYVPLWTGASVLGNSALTQAGTGSSAKVGINTASPATTLDVNGNQTLHGYLSIVPTASATATAGVNSPLLELRALTFQTGGAVHSKVFAWQAQPTGNNTASPSANLSLLFSSAAGPYAPTGLSIAANGVITFAPSQTFPIKGTGGGTITGVTAGTGLTGGGTQGTVTVSVDSTKVPLLGAGTNTFTGAQSFAGTVNFKSPVQIAVNTTPSTPAYPLDVEGGLASQPMVGVVTKGTDAALALRNTGFGGREYWLDSGSTGAGVGAGNFAIWDAQAGARLVIDSGGAVGIGTTTPLGNQLAVVTSLGYAAISATAGSGYGGEFSNTSSTIPTVSATQRGTGSAGYFGNNSASYVALAGENASGDINAVSTYGSISNGMAVYGIAGAGAGVYGTSTSGYGIYGNSSSNIAVYGQSTSSTGVWGQSSGSRGVGVFGAGSIGVEGAYDGGSVSGQELGPQSGVWGDSSSNGTGVVGTTDDSFGGYFANDSSKYPALYAYNNSSGGTGLFRTLSASDPAGTCGFGAGNLSCTGQVKALVSTGGGTRKVETYSVQSPENWMEDFGSGVLERGVAMVRIDPTFAETVSDSTDYHVFLTPKGDSRGLYVINETAASFEVRESGGGISFLAFDYRIVAKRRGFEAQRHVDVTEQYRAAMERTALNRKPRQGGEPTLQAPLIVNPQPHAPSVQ